MEKEKTYIVKDETFTCLYCGMKSYNRNDVMFLYCGNCHCFHEPEDERGDDEQER